MIFSEKSATTPVKSRAGFFRVMLGSVIVR
jgi:hypothetical protein